MNNIILIGFMGCGKTTIGKRLAARLGYQFIDTDKYIETKQKRTVAEIFSMYGEEYFRGLETETIKEMILIVDHAVIATGGGLPLRAENVTLLQQLGEVVLLEIDKDTVLWRLNGDTTRPLLQGDDVQEKVEKLLNERKPYYQKAANYCVKVDQKSHEDIIAEILENYHCDKNNP